MTGSPSYSQGPLWQLWHCLPSEGFSTSLSWHFTWESFTLAVSGCIPEPCASRESAPPLRHIPSSPHPPLAFTLVVHFTVLSPLADPPQWQRSTSHLLQKLLQWVCWHAPRTPAEQGHQDLKANLGYIASSRSTWAYMRPRLKKPKVNKIEVVVLFPSE